MMDYRGNCIMQFFASTIIIGQLTSCGTVLSGSTAKITIDGDVDEPVSITTTKAEYKDASLPIVVEVKRRHLGGQRIRVLSPSYAYHDIVL